MRTDLDDALTYLDKSLAIAPNYTTALNNKGVVLQATGKNNEAITYFDRVLAFQTRKMLTR